MKVVSLKSFRVSLTWMNYNVTSHKLPGITSVPYKVVIQVKPNTASSTEACNNCTEYHINDVMLSPEAKFP